MIIQSDENEHLPISCWENPWPELKKGCIKIPEAKNAAAVKL